MFHSKEQNCILSLGKVNILLKKNQNVFLRNSSSRKIHPRNSKHIYTAPFTLKQPTKQVFTIHTRQTHILHQNESGGGTASPLTLSELLDRGNTLQLRAGRTGEERRGEKRMFTVLVCICITAAVLVRLSPPICFHSSPHTISQT